MQSRATRPAGLSPTLRQLMILVLGVATLLAAFVDLLKNGFLGNRVDMACVNVATLISACPVPWMMLLLFLLDRRGPIRDWYIACCLASWGIQAGLALLLADPVCWVLSGRLTLVFPVFPITALVCLWSLPGAWRSVRPGHCRHCGRASVIAVGTEFVRPRVRIDSGWCAGCGATYRREGMGEWVEEGPAGDGVRASEP